MVGNNTKRVNKNLQTLEAPAPTLPRFFLGHRTTQKGHKKAFRHSRPTGARQLGTQMSFNCSPATRAKNKPQATDTGRPQNPKSGENPKGYMVKRNYSRKVLKRSLTRKRNTCPPTAKVFFGTSHHTKRVQKNLRTQKGSKKSLRHWRPMRPSQTGTHTSDKGLFQKGLKKSLTKKRNTCPPTAKVFFGTSHHTKRVQKKPSHTKRVQKKPSALEAHEAKSNGNPYV